MTENKSDETKARYVWDREKLTWVEAVGQPSVKEPTGVKEVVEATIEEPLQIDSEQIITAETGMEEEEPSLKRRGAWIRLAAIFIDGLIILIVNTIARLIFGSESGITSWLVPIIGAAYFIGLWTWRGQTLGKMIIGAKITRPDGSSIGIIRAFVRYLGYFAYLLIIRFIGGQWYALMSVILVATLIIAFSRDKRGLHDWIAGTIVINTRSEIMGDHEEYEEYEEEENDYAEEGYNIENI